VKVGHLCVGKERVRPPNPGQHFVADAEFVLVFGEVQPWIVPVLTEIKVERVVLQTQAPKDSMRHTDVIIVLDMENTIRSQHCVWHHRYMSDVTASHDGRNAIQQVGLSKCQLRQH
jgi:hypothetical protein